MSPNPTSRSEFSRTCTGVHGDLLANDETIGHELADRLAGIGVGDFVHFVRIEPNLAFAAASDRGREALLGAEIDPEGDQVLAEG